MGAGANALHWAGGAGHYEVYYVSLTDGATGHGVWLRYTMLAPLDPEQAPSCSLWLMAMRPGDGPPTARKSDFPIDRMSWEDEPFELRLAGASLTDRGMRGALADCSWDLTWEPRLAPYEHVHRSLRAARVAQTVLVLPHADLAIEGTVTIAGSELVLDGARGGQAHLWGSAHARRWAWVHCNDFRGLDGSPRRDTFVDGVSVVVDRLGRELGPSTPVVARVGGEDFRSVSPLRVIANRSDFGLTSWRFEATAGRRRLIGDIHADRGQLVGVTYRDPDGAPAYCYNSEVSSMRLSVWERVARGARWELIDTLSSDRRAHFEYGQREPVAGLPLLV